MTKSASQINDTDPQETTEWINTLGAVITHEAMARIGR